MIHLTPREEEIMRLFWEHGPMSVSSLRQYYDEPRPHVNTLSTLVRILEEKHCVGHEAQGKGFVYYPVVTADQVGTSTVKSVVERFFSGSFSGLVSALVKDEDVSVDELRSLLDEIERNRQNR